MAQLFTTKKENLEQLVESLFYRKNKKTIPQDAGKYFSADLNENLKIAGDHYYHIIADALKQLNQVNKDSARELTVYLRQNYNHRRNLMSMNQ